MLRTACHQGQEEHARHDRAQRGNAAASEEVSASAEEVNATMHTLNQFTVELDDIASHLTEAIDKFEL